jgi:DNA mismatch repair protein MutS2
VEEKKKLESLVRENERLKKEMQVVMDKERHRQQVEVLKQQNRITEERITYLKDMERKLRQVVIDWKKTDDKQAVIKHLKDLLFKKDTAQVVSKAEKKIQQQYQEISTDELKPGMLVKLKKNYQVGEVKEIRGKKAIVQIGQLPMQLSLSDLVAVEKIIQPQQKTV